MSDTLLKIARITEHLDDDDVTVMLLEISGMYDGHLNVYYNMIGPMIFLER